MSILYTLLEIEIISKLTLDRITAQFCAKQNNFDFFFSDNTTSLFEST